MNDKEKIKISVDLGRRNESTEPSRVLELYEQFKEGKTIRDGKEEMLITKSTPNFDTKTGVVMRAEVPRVDIEAECASDKLLPKLKMPKRVAKTSVRSVVEARKRSNNGPKRVS